MLDHGILPCPQCGAYPKVKPFNRGGFVASCDGRHPLDFVCCAAFGKTEEAAMDEWERMWKRAEKT